MSLNDRFCFVLGQRYAAIDILIHSDQIYEENEKFRLKLRKPRNTVIGKRSKSSIHIVNLHQGTQITEKSLKYRLKNTKIFTKMCIFRSL